MKVGCFFAVRISPFVSLFPRTCFLHKYLESAFIEPGGDNSNPSSQQKQWGNPCPASSFFTPDGLIGSHIEVQLKRHLPLVPLIGIWSRGQEAVWLSDSVLCNFSSQFKILSFEHKFIRFSHSSVCQKILIGLTNLYLETGIKFPRLLSAPLAYKLRQTASNNNNKVGHLRK